MNTRLDHEHAHPQTRRARRARLALSLLTALTCTTVSSLAQAEACPSARLPANNGSSFAACTPVPVTPKQASHPAPGASCPLASDPRVRDLVINSVAVGNKPLKTRVIVPKNYETQPNKKWPVLYLLTGHGSSYESWTCGTKLRQYVENLDILVVMPDGHIGYAQTAASYTPDDLSGLGNADTGIPSWYSDWKSPQVSINNSSSYGPHVQMKLATHHTQELRDVLNKNFRADNARYAVGGLSMGGFGAATYALGSTSARPFIAVATLSPLLDTEFLSANVPFVGGIDAPSVVRGSIEAAQAANGEVILTGNRLWGEKTSQLWRDNNPRRRVAAGGSRLHTIPFYLSIGQGNSRTDIDYVARFNDGSLDAAELGPYLSSGTFLNAFTRTQPGFTVEYFPRGKHNWTHWNVNICRALNLTLVKALDSTQTPLPLSSCPTL